MHIDEALGEAPGDRLNKTKNELAKITRVDRKKVFEFTFWIYRSGSGHDGEGTHRRSRSGKRTGIANGL
jgi:hypothetical protein